jgi:ribosomal-protein-alanine N-acetyltransferase
MDEPIASASDFLHRVTAITIRRTVVGDEYVLRALLAKIPEAAQWNELPGSAGGFYCCVAECDGRVCGLIAFRIMADEAEILNLAVEEGQRRRRIGSRLMGKAVAECESAGVRKIFLEVRESNAAAQTFYARRGFRVEGRRRAYYREPTEDALVLVRSIVESAEKVL